MDYYKTISETPFLLFLLKIDRSIAKETHSRACPHCGGKLNWANFHRSGCGLPNDAADILKVRFSLCCREDGCRKRVTPKSVRFLRGMAYTSITVTLACAIRQGLSVKCAKELGERLGIRRQTLARWIRWWRDRFLPSRFWQGHRARFAPLLDEDSLPRSLVESFLSLDSDIASAFRKLLRFIAPWSDFSSRLCYGVN
jgi:hypothetical protein